VLKQSLHMASLHSSKAPVKVYSFQDIALFGNDTNFNSTNL